MSRQRTIEEIIEASEKKDKEKEVPPTPRTEETSMGALFTARSRYEKEHPDLYRVQQEKLQKDLSILFGKSRIKEQRPKPDLAAATHRPVPVNQKSLKQLLHSLIYKKKKLPHPLALAQIAQSITTEQRLHDLKQIAAQLKLEVKTRKEITDYKARNAKAKIRIGKNTYYLFPADIGESKKSNDSLNRCIS